MKEKNILLAHGSGGKLMHELIEKYFVKAFENEYLNSLDDAASLPLESSELAFTTDTYVVNPIFFKGGNIGRLAVCGTVNDLSMKGAIPKYLSCAFLIEEGFPLKDLEKIINSMVEAAKEAEVMIVTGDTKVVEKGSADKIFINTAGVGVIPEGVNISGSNAKPGDVVIVSGTIGDHGIAVLSEREGIAFESNIESDVAPLNKLVEEILKVTKNVHVLRDPTRGGLSSTLNEIATHSNVGIIISEEKIPIKEEVLGACEMLGFDPLHVANEGKLIAILPEKEAEKVLQVMRNNPYGKEAAIIGEVKEEPKGKVLVKTLIGTNRILDMLVGEQLPRIC
jgi:hydrogenase expression/formation protein HypE